MVDELTGLKHTYGVMLDPLIDLFDHKKNLLSAKEWLTFIENTKASILSNPEQYIGTDVPEKVVLRQVINGIFADYLEAEVINA
jgi:hypothetical protein